MLGPAAAAGVSLPLPDAPAATIRAPAPAVAGVLNAERRAARARRRAVRRIASRAARRAVLRATLRCVRSAALGTSSAWSAMDVHQPSVDNHCPTPNASRRGGGSEVKPDVPAPIAVVEAALSAATSAIARAIERL